MAKKSKAPSRPRITSAAASKKLLSELPTGTEMELTISRLKSLGHQATATVGLSYLEHLLELLLKTNCRSLSSDDANKLWNGAGNGILGSFSAKVRIVHAFKVISESGFHDLMLLGAIRNTFAHTLHKISFDQPDIAADCRKLKMRKEADEKSGGSEFGPPKEPIDLFIDTIWYISYALRLEINSRARGAGSTKSIPSRYLFE